MSKKPLPNEPQRQERELPEYPVAELVKMKNDRNPRWMPEQKAAALKVSIQRFSMLEAVIVNTRTNRVVGGHQRIDAAVALKMETLPVDEIDLSEEEEAALNLALNNNKGEWDYDLLPDVIAGITDPLLLAATGFTEEERAAIANMKTVSEIEEQDGIAEEIANMEPEEIQRRKETIESVALGMFAKRFPKAVFEVWIGALERTAKDKSFFGLGLEVAKRLGIKVYTEQAKSENEADTGQVDDTPGLADISFEQLGEIANGDAE